jgi:aldose 1-epimerase
VPSARPAPVPGAEGDAVVAAHAGGAPMQILELRAGRLRAALRPDLGGALAGLWRDDRALLHGCEPQALTSVDDSACFPCAPFAQELGRATLRWMDATYSLERPLPALPHALHGVAWRRRWDIVAVRASSAEMRYRHGPDEAWPFAFDIHQVVELKRSSLALQLRLTNQHDAPQPAGLGWQIGFARRTGARLDLACRARWDLDPLTHLPRERTEWRGEAGDVEGSALDHTYDGWRGALRVRDDVATVRMRASLDRLCIAMRGHQSHWRAGPVSHAPDAFHMGSPTGNGLVVLPPGASMEAWVRLSIGR